MSVIVCQKLSEIIFNPAPQRGKRLKTPFSTHNDQKSCFNWIKTIFFWLFLPQMKLSKIKFPIMVSSFRVIVVADRTVNLCPDVLTNSPHKHAVQTESWALNQTKLAAFRYIFSPTIRTYIFIFSPRLVFLGTVENWTANKSINRRYPTSVRSGRIRAILLEFAFCCKFFARTAVTS